MIKRIAPALAAAVAAALLSWPAPGAAQDQDQTKRERAEEMAREGMERILRSLDLLMESIPQYELPEVNDEGDIIIRRKNPPEATPETPRQEPDATDT